MIRYYEKIVRNSRHLFVVMMSFNALSFFVCSFDSLHVGFLIVTDFCRVIEPVATLLSYCSSSPSDSISSKSIEPSAAGAGSPSSFFSSST